MTSYFYSISDFSKSNFSKAKFAMRSGEASLSCANLFSRIQLDSIYNAVKSVADFDIVVEHVDTAHTSMAYVNVDCNIYSSVEYVVPIVASLSKLVEAFSKQSSYVEFDLIYEKQEHIRTVGVCVKPK